MTMKRNPELEIRSDVIGFKDGELVVEVFYSISQENASPGPQIGHFKGKISDLPDEVKVKVFQNYLHSIGLKGTIFVDPQVGSGPVCRSPFAGQIIETESQGTIDYGEFMS